MPGLTPGIAVSDACPISSSPQSRQHSGSGRYTPGRLFWSRWPV